MKLIYSIIFCKYLQPEIDKYIHTYRCGSTLAKVANNFSIIEEEKQYEVFKILLSHGLPFYIQCIDDNNEYFIYSDNVCIYDNTTIWSIPRFLENLNEFYSDENIQKLNYFKLMETI